ncbi:hypothetical protein [Pseudarthrobacter sp. PS3-L1]|uniref:hypothetical protein n=1 Tax=Pseudarthrobacter sp. PS3-L1 TaxID=3046207 RepID=UPI0024BB4C25|nr:hypothetical protein [Pseudarthrobacter sp. PS3-L1]MDJ0320261.1 hypothetical protein [Pseudarthrobacter sp. PS3-L1]
MNAASSPIPPAIPAPAASDATPRVRSSRGLVLLGIGSVLALCGMALLAVIIAGTATLQTESLARIANRTVTYRAEFGLVERKLSGLSALTAGPGILLVTATCFLIPGYLRRRGTMHGIPTSGLRGGSVLATYRPLALWAHGLWSLVPLAAWVLLILVPLRSMAGGGWPAGLREENSTAVWLALGFYGAVASGLFAVVVTSLIKKAYFLAWLRQHPDTPVDEGKGAFWRWVCFTWRFDLWLAGFGGALIGVCWIGLEFDGQQFVMVAALTGLALLLAGIIMSLNYWRANRPLGTALSNA